MVEENQGKTFSIVYHSSSLIFVKLILLKFLTNFNRYFLIEYKKIVEWNECEVENQGSRINILMND